jgi:hypothetical protein
MPTGPEIAQRSGKFAEMRGLMIGRGGAGASTGRQAWAAGIAVVLAVSLSLAPPAVAPATAATGRLLVTSAATYSVDVDAGVVHVVDAVTLRNDKPSDADFFYIWRDLSWSVHPGATRIAVRDPDGSLAVTPRARDGFTEAEFRLRRDLLFGQSIDLTISWDLPGGAPRSDSSIRIGQAFASFELWAWGDPGSSSVTATLPGGFEVQTYGSTVETANAPSAPGGVTVSASAIDDPADFWVAVTATRDGSLAIEELRPSRDVTLLVKGWPEDELWLTTVTTTLERGLSELQELIGLPWPVTSQLVVTEVYSPLLEGYAGIYYTAEDRIEISEDLDDLVIVHELSHAWFNDGLFTDRWIDEGLADTYAAITLEALGEDRQLPEEPQAGDEGRLDLVSWGPPERITDETAARETYAYNAAWFVGNGLVEEVGAAAMRAIFRAAHDDRIAYRGAGPAEPVPAPDGWRRYLDLLEEIGGSTTAERLFREYVVTPDGVLELDARSGAREAYAGLLEAGDGWLPPYYVRSELSAWRFPAAGTRIAEASDLLALRDRIDEAATALGLEPDDSLEAAYESAADSLVAAEVVATAELGALDDLAAADAATRAAPDLVATVGLIGEAPRSGYEAAAAAFEAGDLEAAGASASDALALVADAPRVGRERLLAAVGIVVGIILLLGLFVALRRRRRSGAPRAAVTASGTEPYATLAANSPAPAPDADRAGDPDGGTADGEGSSASP